MKHSKQECPVCKTGYSVDEKNGTNCRRCGYPWPELAPPAQQAPAEPVDGEGDSAQLDSGQKLA